MSVSVRCPGCTATLKGSERLYGKTIRCPRCQTELAVPYPKVTEAGPRPVPVEAPPSSSAESADDGYALAAPAPNSSYSAPPVLSLHEVPLPRRRRRQAGDEQTGSVSPEGSRLWVNIGISVAATLLLFVGGYLALQYAMRTPPPPVTPEDRWQVLEVPGRFKVRLPGPCECQRPSALGVTMVLYSCQLEKDSLYAAGYMESEIPAHRRTLPVETLLNDGCEGALANVPGTHEVSRDSIQLGPYPGKQLVMYIPQGHGKMIARVYLAHDHVYILLAGGPGLDSSHPNVRRLFDSFEILDTGAPPR